MSKLLKHRPVCSTFNFVLHINCTSEVPRDPSFHFLLHLLQIGFKRCTKNYSNVKCVCLTCGKSCEVVVGQTNFQPTCFCKNFCELLVARCCGSRIYWNRFLVWVKKDTTQGKKQKLSQIGIIIILHVQEAWAWELAVTPTISTSPAFYVRILAHNTTM